MWRASARERLRKSCGISSAHTISAALWSVWREPSLERIAPLLSGLVAGLAKSSPNPIGEVIMFTHLFTTLLFLLSLLVSSTDAAAGEWAAKSGHKITGDFISLEKRESSNRVVFFS